MILDLKNKRLTIWIFNILCISSTTLTIFQFLPFYLLLRFPSIFFPYFVYILLVITWYVLTLYHFVLCQQKSLWNLLCQFQDLLYHFQDLLYHFHQLAVILFLGMCLFVLYSHSIVSLFLFVYFFVDYVFACVFNTICINQL